MSLPFVRPDDLSLESVRRRLQRLDLRGGLRRRLRHWRRAGQQTISPLGAIAICAVAAFLGIGSAWWAITAGIGFEHVRIGVWTTWPTAGEERADPYLRARLARTGELVLSASEGVMLTAREDEAGRPLLSNCVYRVSGKMPAAQWWTLTAYRDEDRSLMETPARRSGFRSDLVLREPDDAVVVTVSPRARGGNWLPVDPEAGDIRLVLRLYDTPLATGGKLADAEMPAVERVSCE